MQFWQSVSVAQPTHSTREPFPVSCVNAVAIATCRDRPELIARAVCNIWHTNCNISALDGGTGRSASLVVCLLYLRQNRRPKDAQPLQCKGSGLLLLTTGERESSPFGVELS
jgi:hypothetical protein